VKLLEGLFLLGAGVLFAWWQLRDVSKAQAESARKRMEKSDSSQADTNQNSKETP